jgi:hypothetical protein
MAATEILVRFVSICKYSHRRIDWYFQGSVKRLPSSKTVFVGDPDEGIEMLRGATHRFSGWEIPVKIQPKDTSIEIRLSGTREQPTMDVIANIVTTERVSIGDVKATLNVPIHHGYNLWMVSSEGTYSALIIVEVTKDTATAPGKISTVVAHQGASAYNTVHDGMQDMMVHICPVIPVPSSTVLPEPAKGVKDFAEFKEDLSIFPGATKPNDLVNPALIPALSLSHRDFGSLCARIRITRYRPWNLDLNRLIWKAVTDNVRFFDGGGDKKEIRGGQEIKAYGVLKGKADDAECRIEVRWDEPGQPLLAVYRALVGPPKYLHYRANIIKHKPGFFSFLSKKIPDPTVTFDAVRKRLLYNNVLMWQAGIMLVPDPDTTAYNEAVWMDKGIFVVYTSKNQTFNMDPDDDDDDYYPTILNQRADILNICYIHSHHSHSGDNPSGLARDRFQSPASKIEELGGSPSTSWVFPTGVYPDAAGGIVKMKTMGPNRKRRPKWQKSVAGDGQIDKVCGLAIVDEAAVIPNANTEAHEIGHVLGLVHRGSGEYKERDMAHMRPSKDGVNHMAGPNKGKGHPWEENIMSYSGYYKAQDFDLIQTKVMRRHPLVKDAPLK